MEVVKKDGWVLFVLENVLRDPMVKVAVNNVALTAMKPADVTDSQDDVTMGVNQDGKALHAMNIATKPCMVLTAQRIVDQIVSTFLVIM